MSGFGELRQPAAAPLAAYALLPAAGIMPACARLPASMPILPLLLRPAGALRDHTGVVSRLGREHHFFRSDEGARE